MKFIILGTMMKLKERHITLQSTQEMQEISSPLKLLNVDFFSYTRFYFDGTSISLLTHTDWYQNFLKQEIPNCVNVFGLKTSVNLWVETFPERANMEAKNNYNIDNGINFVQRNNDYVELISYATKSNLPNGLAYFLANIDLLEKFIHYFKEKAEPLIKNAIKERIVIPKIMRGYQDVHSSLTVDKETRRTFLKQIDYDKKIRQLSKRELQCLKYLAKGNSAKQIAKNLGISSRTVETHITNLKNKMNLYHKNELFDLYWDIVTVNEINFEVFLNDRINNF